MKTLTPEAANKILVDLLTKQAKEAVGSILKDDIPLIQTIAQEATAVSMRQAAGDERAAMDMQVLKATLASMRSTRTTKEASRFHEVLLQAAEIGGRVLVGAMKSMA
jgi:hypothetical protein